MKTNVKPTSRKSHKINIDGQLYRPAEEKIVLALRGATAPLSRTELELITGLRINQITGRVNNLVARNLAKISGKKICSVTGSEVEGVLIA